MKAALDRYKLHVYKTTNPQPPLAPAPEGYVSSEAFLWLRQQLTYAYTARYQTIPLQNIGLTELYLLVNILKSQRQYETSTSGRTFPSQDQILLNTLERVIALREGIPAFGMEGLVFQRIGEISRYHIGDSAHRFVIQFRDGTLQTFYRRGYLNPTLMGKVAKFQVGPQVIQWHPLESFPEDLEMFRSRFPSEGEWFHSEHLPNPAHDLFDLSITFPSLHEDLPWAIPDQNRFQLPVPKDFI